MSLSRAEIDELLKQEEIVYVATADLISNPHLKPIWFVIYNGSIWFETHTPTVAFKNIKQNNKVMLCFGGKKTYLVWGKVEWFTEKEAPIPFRKMLWDKYGKDMHDSYITEKTLIFKVVVSKEVSWHYADQNWE